MLAIVRIALQRPYTFIVMAMLILIFGVMAWIRTPTDVFPDIGIPVVSVVWTYNGLPPDDMSGRVIYYYERTLSSQVNDIKHIESQSLTGYGIVKVFFQPSVNINTAIAGYRGLANGAQVLAPGYHAALCVALQCFQCAGSAARDFERHALPNRSSSTTRRIS